MHRIKTAAAVAVPILKLRFHVALSARLMCRFNTFSGQRKGRTFIFGTRSQTAGSHVGVLLISVE